MTVLDCGGVNRAHRVAGAPAGHVILPARIPYGLRISSGARPLMVSSPA
ncbi:MAG: hypothetical protein LBS91_01520 [Clostridiales Family XIII bacterium]|nr:hypothetical protein [Clostridiales Family XIII bacterium]